MVRFMFFLTERHTHRKIAAHWAGFLCLLLAGNLAGCSDTPPAAVAQETAAIRTPTTAASLVAPTPTRQPNASTTPSLEHTPTSLPSSTPTALACWAAGGRFESGSLETDLLRHPLEYRVYLPPCYDQQPNQAYPVLYLIHGQSYNDDQWERLGAGEIADRLIAAGELPPLLMVMPRDRLWSEPSEDLFGQAIVEVLLPWVEANYRTTPERPFRAVGGLSRGGAWALHLGLTYPELFSAVGMHSGFVFHSDAPYLRIWLDETPFEQMPRFYLDVADNDRPDIYDSAVWFEAMLTEFNLPHEWHVFIGYHEEAYWQAHVEQYLRWYAQRWLFDD
jgi:enterochelin esterase-like enzyme